MNDQKQENYNIAMARETAQKFDFYFIALIFTILGLALQTSSISNIRYQYISEFLAWVSLLVAGLVGLSRLEWIPVAYENEGHLQTEEINLKIMNEGLAGRPVINEFGEEWSQEKLETAKAKLKTNITKRKNFLKSIDKKTPLKYKVQKYAFAVGIVSLTISRIILGLNKIWG